MTVDEAYQVARSVSVHHPGLRGLTISTRIGYAGLMMEISYTPPDRDTGEPVTISMGKVWGPERLVNFNRGWLLEEIKAMVWSAFEHEYKECFHVDGVRIMDPHPVTVPPTTLRTARLPDLTLMTVDELAKVPMDVDLLGGDPMKKP